MNRSAILNKSIKKVLKTTIRLLEHNNSTIIKPSSSSSSNNNKIDYLKQLFKPLNRPNFYQEYLLENRQIKSLKRASVLVPISHNSSTNEYEYTLTKRMDHLRTHKGQICFAGGMKDDVDENEIRTAYREAYEEIGIDESKLTFLAQLVPVCTSAGVLLTPIVVYFDQNDFKPKINKDEVDFMFNLETKRFLEARGHTSRSLGGFYVHYFDDKINVNSSMKSINTWGVTAFLCVCLSSAIHKQLPEFSIDPSAKLEGDKLNEFLEHYLKVKSKSLISVFAAKTKISDTLKSIW